MPNQQVSILFLLEGASNRLMLFVRLLFHLRFNPFSAGRGIKSSIEAGYINDQFMFQSFFCWKGHQILVHVCFAACASVVSILFLLEGASNHGTTNLEWDSVPDVSILFLLEGASNLKSLISAGNSIPFQSFFCWKGHQIL